MTQPQPNYQQQMPTCWWHPNRHTGLSCTRCGRPACPDCLRDASVGSQCIDCVQAGQRQDRSQQRQYRAAGLGARTVAGARVSTKVVVTPVLIALNAVLYVVTAVQAKSPMDNGASALSLDGVMFPLGVGQQGEWWRLLTSGFLHFGLVHIAVNMFSLWMLGRDLELLLGKVRFTAVYLVSLLGGSVAVYLFDNPAGTTAGASGAIYGLLGGILIAVLRLKLNPVPALGVIALNLVISFSLPNISILAHLGGLVIGALVTAAILYAPEKARVAWQTGALVLVACALVVGVVVRDAQVEKLACYGTSRGVTCVDRSTTGA